MTHSITEEMRFRQRLCEYAKKYGVTKAARKYQTNRQFTYRQLSRYDGTVQSLALRSRRPHNSPKAHTEKELDSWQNGKVEGSHREDGKILYGCRTFTSEKELEEQVAKHEKRYNSTAKTSLAFKSPNQVVTEYFSHSGV